jgi:putative oxidoreductase
MDRGGAAGGRRHPVAAFLKDVPMTSNDILRTNESGWTLLVRLLVGLIVFLPEGIQKLAYPDILGAGRFARIGIPFPEIMGPFVGMVEIICGALIILGLFTRLAAVPLIVIMIVALVSTKLPILLGHDVGMFHLSADMKRTGFWSAMHESRADLTMLLGCTYLLIVGAGKWSLDARLVR